jgi:hypothetical protein
VQAIVIWNLLDGGLSHSGPLLGPPESMWGGTSGTNPHHYKKKEGDFTRLCLMTKGRSSRNNSNFDVDFDVSDDLSYDGLSSKVHKLEDALCSQDKLLCRIFCENKDLNLKLENSFAETASLQSMRNDMSAQPCENCNMIMVNYADLWIAHTQVSSQLKSAKMELKTHSLLLGA